MSAINIQRINNRENVFLLTGYQNHPGGEPIQIIAAREELCDELNEMFNRIGGEDTMRASMGVESTRRPMADYDEHTVAVDASTIRRVSPGTSALTGFYANPISHF